MMMFEGRKEIHCVTVDRERKKCENKKVPTQSFECMSASMPIIFTS